jgi:hypothetical protein
MLKNSKAMKRIVWIGALLLTGLAQAQEAEPEINQQTWDIRCYPNPTSDLLMVTSSLEIKAITLFDLNGQLIKVPALPNWCFSLHELPAGWIFMYIESADGRIEKKNIYKN